MHPAGDDRGCNFGGTCELGATACTVRDDPLPLIAGIRCSIGDYDVEGKVADCQQRGDLELWLIHPHERTLTAWVRQPDGSYEETTYREGIVRLSSLPGVTIDLDALCDA